MTHREMEVLKLVARGMNNRDIAGKLGVGLRTVKSHLETIFSKMDVNSRTEAVLEALKRGWVSIEGD
jgi:DNA-binding NarL/FixJ family response regulator